jgi:hypothetical protein
VNASGWRVAGVEIGTSKVKEGRSDSRLSSERMLKASWSANRGSRTSELYASCSSAQQTLRWLRECKTGAAPESTVTLCASLANPAFETLTAYSPRGTASK